MLKKLDAHFPWILMSILITIQSSVSSIYLPDVGVSFIDKLLHFIVFGIWGLSLTRGLLMTESDFAQKNLFIIVIIAGMLFAFSDELHQSFVPGRTSDIYDWVADISGILFFSYLYKLFIQRKNKVETE
ncbi:MAG: VanZ family protein [Calditrichaceae bacterium]